MSAPGSPAPSDRGNAPGTPGPMTSSGGRATSPRRWRISRSSRNSSSSSPRATASCPGRGSCCNRSGAAAPDAFPCAGEARATHENARAAVAARDSPCEAPRRGFGRFGIGRGLDRRDNPAPGKRVHTRPRATGPHTTMIGAAGLGNSSNGGAAAAHERGHCPKNHSRIPFVGSGAASRRIPVLISPRKRTRWRSPSYGNDALGSGA